MVENPAYDEGYQMGFGGGRQDQNPYAHNVASRGQWARGFADGQHDARKRAAQARAAQGQEQDNPTDKQRKAAAARGYQLGLDGGDYAVPEDITGIRASDFHEGYEQGLAARAKAQHDHDVALFDKAAADTIRPISRAEKKRLDELETVIKRNFRAFYAVGKALQEIRDRKLYRSQFATFEGYVKQVWDMGVRHAEHHMAAAGVLDDLTQNLLPGRTEIGQNANNCSGSDSGPLDNGQVIDVTPAAGVPAIPVQIPMWDDEDHLPLPKNEAQARALARLTTPEERAAAWREAVNRAAEKGTAVTSTLVARVVKEMGGEKITSSLTRARRSLDGERVSPEFKAAFDAFMQEIQRAHDDDWRQTDRKAAIRHAEMILQAIRLEGVE